MSAAVPVLIASGRLIIARMVNAYAHHIVATPLVIWTASQPLNPVCSLAMVATPCFFRASICGCEVWFMVYSSLGLLEGTRSAGPDVKARRTGARRDPRTP